MPENEEDEDFTYEDLIEQNNMQINALIELLIQKKILTREELEKKIDDLYPIDDNEEDEDEDLDEE